MTYREAGRSPLGEVRHRFVIGRRTRYLGSANAAARSSLLGPGGLLPSSGRAPSLPATGRAAAGVIELCDGGLRVRTSDGVLELLWDQVTEVRPVMDDAGLVAVIVGGIHGESVNFDRSVRGLADLLRVLEELRPRSLSPR